MIVTSLMLAVMTTVAGCRRDARRDTGAPAAAPSTKATATVVDRTFPSSDTIPANILRLYLYFTAPMSPSFEQGGVSLLDEHGARVEGAFFPYLPSFWNPAHTRYTLFFDPARVKRAMPDHRRLGWALAPGHRYTLVIDSTWRDALGRSLAHAYRRTFVASTPDTTPLALSSWRVHSPALHSRDPVVVVFPRPVDAALARATLGVQSNGEWVPGQASVTTGEREWRFVPTLTWRPGRYRLLVSTLLEDPAGNRIDRPFEVDRFSRSDSTTLDQLSIPLMIR